MQVDAIIAKRVFLYTKHMMKRLFHDEPIINLVSRLTRGDPVTLTYTDPTIGNDRNAIQDEAGNDAPSFSLVAQYHPTGQQSVLAGVNAAGGKCDVRQWTRRFLSPPP